MTDLQHSKWPLVAPQWCSCEQSEMVLQLSLGGGAPGASGSPSPAVTKMGTWHPADTVLSRAGRGLTFHSEVQGCCREVSLEALLQNHGHGQSNSTTNSGIEFDCGSHFTVNVLY